MVSDVSIAKHDIYIINFSLSYQIIAIIAFVPVQIFLSEGKFVYQTSLSRASDLQTFALEKFKELEYAQHKYYEGHKCRHSRQTGKTEGKVQKASKTEIQIWH